MSNEKHGENQIPPKQQKYEDSYEDWYLLSKSMSKYRIPCNIQRKRNK